MATIDDTNQFYPRKWAFLKLLRCLFFQGFITLFSDNNVSSSFSATGMQLPFPVLPRLFQE